MSIKNKLAMLGIMAAMFEGGANKSDLRPQDIDVKPKKKIIPKGCKEYSFNYYNDKNEQCVFTCIAMTDKKAREKFERHTQPPHP